MPDQKVMRVHFQSFGNVFPGDIIQCPACRWKWVVLPGMINDNTPYWDIQTQGPPPPGWEDAPRTIVCPNCGNVNSVAYHEEIARTGGIELTNWGKPEPKPKEAKPDGQSRSRKGTTKQRTGVKDRGQKD